MKEEMISMTTYNTLYGGLNHISFDFYYENGVLKECLCEEKSALETSIGSLIPKYYREEARAKNRNSVTFYKSGKLKSIYLQEQITIPAPLGPAKAEFITFYEEGSIHRIFPRYGQISGFWSEEEELEMLEPCTEILNGIQFKHKISCFCFYPSGKLKSITLGKGEIINITTPIGTMSARVGISFHENGVIASVEPNKPEVVKTPIGPMVAYDNAPIGIHGDINSVKFTQEGQIFSIKTIMSGIELSKLKQHNKSESNRIRVLPEHQRSQIDIEKFEMVPIEIKFGDNGIEILDSNGRQHRFSVFEYKMKSIYNPLYRDDAVCSNCDSCNGCQT